MRLNYVIATYNGKSRRRHTHPEPCDILKVHLQKVLEHRHGIGQLTIMRPESDNHYPSYYEIDALVADSPIPIQIIGCENYGYSEGQFLKAYEIFQDEFDYFFFIEDDYCPNMPRWVDMLVDCHRSKFPAGVGLLCSLVQGSPNYAQYQKTGKYPIHWEGSILASAETMGLLYADSRWEGVPRQYLDRIDSEVDPGYPWEIIRESYLGAYYQLTFSHMFTLSGVVHDDYLDVTHQGKLLQIPYWDDNAGNRTKRRIWFRTKRGIWFYDKGDVMRKDFTLGDIRSSPILPVQLARDEYIRHHTGLHV